MSFTLPRPPRTDDELYWLIAALWGVKLPRQKVCDNHISPFEAVAEAFFGREPGYAVWYATRGSGKSLALAVLAATKAFIADADVTILGGSMTQSLNVRSHIADLLRYKNAPTYALARNNATELETTTGTRIRPIPASQTTVRGPHPPLSLLDEVDEMEYAIYEAAMGQAMAQVNTRGEVVNEYIVASSTWQNPEGTFTKIMEQARARGLPVYSWCWRELLEPHGWMTERFINQKRRTISEQMWKTEYDLNEPSGASRAMDLDKVEAYFVDYPEPVRRVDKGDEEQVWVYEDPQPAGIYAVGADWAKERDYTVISVIRYDVEPRRLVKLTRINRRPWPVMFGLFNKDVAAYNDAVSQHDKTGLGSVAQDFVDTDTDGGFMFIGRKRTQMLLDYITAFEHGGYRLPKNLVMGPEDKNVLKVAHRAITVADVYAPGKWDTHLPDEFASISLAHRAAEKMPAPISEYTARAEVKRDGDPVAKDFRQFQTKPYEGAQSLRAEGGVAVVDERYDSFTDWFRD